MLARARAQQLDSLGRHQHPDRALGDLDEYAIAALRADPVDAYGVGTPLVTGSGAPTAGMVYKLVEVDGRPVEKRSENKSHGGRKSRHTAAPGHRHRHRGIVHPGGRADRRASPSTTGCCRCRWSGPARVESCRPWPQSREHRGATLVTLPWEGLNLKR